MAPILEDMELHLQRDLNVGVEIPSYVDDIMVCILDSRGRRKMSTVLENASQIVTQVARVKWLGIIIDENLLFDIHWIYRLEKARKLLGALNGIGSSQWGVSPAAGGSSIPER